MTDDDGTLDAESCESLSEQIRLSGRSRQGVLELAQKNRPVPGAE
jgi:hypothetical protein